MPNCPFCGEGHRAGFIAKRLAGTDGVSLESAKWEQVFEGLGTECYYFAGELDRPPDRSYQLDLAHFTAPEIKSVYLKCFGTRKRSRRVSNEIYRLKEIIKDHLYRFIRRHSIELLVTENAQTIPLNLPLGIALTEVIAETGIPTIAHHHDFFWERQRFLTNSVWDILNMAFPPHLPSIQHVVINSSGDNQLSLRTGISATTIPNVMDFENPPPAPDDYTSDVRRDLGVADDELLILQPTRVVKRKGIEHAIELVNRLGMKAKLVISHASGDEGFDYEMRVRDYSKLMGVDTVFVSDIILEERGLTEDGRKIYTLEDIYPYADLVTYPSNFEGFGNAFLEAVYFRKPIVVNNYSIYSSDIKPRGFKVVEIDGYVTTKAVTQTRRILKNPDHCKKIVEQNYQIAAHCFSYRVLRRKLRSLLFDCLSCGFMPEASIEQ
jgi:glycosyltransferase involved in cell wall biosynthesis